MCEKNSVVKFANMTEQEIKVILREINWDTKCTVDELYDVFTGKVERVYQVDKDWLRTRILNGNYWYKVLDIYSKEELKEVLKDSNINNLFPRSLREKYKHVKSVLFR